jgi:hypothetical protein
MWVIKAADESILARCLVCQTDEVVIQNWQKTEWANGMMQPAPVNLDGPTVH